MLTSYASRWPHADVDKGLKGIFITPGGLDGAINCRHHRVTLVRVGCGAVGLRKLGQLGAGLG